MKSKQTKENQIDDKLLSFSNISRTGKNIVVKHSLFDNDFQNAYEKSTNRYIFGPASFF